MRTLEQVEPRTPITNLPVTLNAPGSYYLVTNLTGVAGLQGITINWHNITVDLMGFELRGVADSASGILVSGQLTNLCVRNGTIRDWGSRGINGGSSHNSQFFDLRVTGNAFGGLEVGQGSQVRTCTAHRNGGYGISVGDNSSMLACTAVTNSTDGVHAGDNAVVKDCIADSNLGAGIFAGPRSVISGCTAVRNTAEGIYASYGSTVVDGAANENGGTGIGAGGVVSRCAVYSNKGIGIDAPGCCVVIKDCAVRANLGGGIRVTSQSIVAGNLCDGNGDFLTPATVFGIRATGAANRIEGNQVALHFGGYGVRTDVAGNIIIRNTATGNSTNFFFTGVNTFGPTNTVFGEISTTNPWANISY